MQQSRFLSLDSRYVTGFWMALLMLGVGSYVALAHISQGTPDVAPPQLHQPMKSYLLLLRGGTFEAYSETEMEQIIERYREWAEQLQSAGKFIDGNELQDGGRTLTRKDGKVVVDGPFAETKEMVGGYFLISAASYDEAVEISKACPHLEFGGTVEIRELVTG